MERRTFVLGIGTVFSSGMVTGCSAIGGSSGPDKPEDTEPQPDPEPNQQSGGNAETKAQLVGDYQIAYEGVQTSKETLNTVFDSFESENYSLVTATLSDFESQVETFSTSFEEAATAATELGDNDVRQACTAGKNEARAIGNAGTYIMEAANQASDGNDDEAQTKLAQAQAALESAQEHHQDVLQPNEVQTRIGYRGPTM